MNYKEYKFKYKGKIYYVVEMPNPYINDGYKSIQGNEIILVLNSTLPARKKQTLLHKLIKDRNITKLIAKWY